MPRIVNHLPQPRDPETEKQLARVQVALGTAVRKHRHAKLITQEELAERASLHANYIGSVERGERNVSLFNLWRIAHGLGMTTSELLVDLPAPRRRAAKGQ